jgi:hypothetical protein
MDKPTLEFNQTQSCSLLKTKSNLYKSPSSLRTTTSTTGHKKFTQKLHYYTFKNLKFKICISFKFPLLSSLKHHPYIITKLLYALKTNWNTSITISQFPLFITFNLSLLERFRNFQAKVTIPLRFWGLKEAKGIFIPSWNTLRKSIDFFQYVSFLQFRNLSS